MNAPNNRDEDILNHIRRHCEVIFRAIDRFGSRYEDFTGEEMFRDGVSMNIQQIGELAGHLSEDFKISTQHMIPWKAIKGMRNLFAHDYHNMDTRKIWNTVIEDIPVLYDFCSSQIESCYSFEADDEDEAEFEP